MSRTDKGDTQKHQAKEPETQALNAQTQQANLTAALQRARVDPRSLTLQDMLPLQHTLGNRYLQRAIAKRLQKDQAPPPDKPPKSSLAGSERNSQLVQRLTDKEVKKLFKRSNISLPEKAIIAKIAELTTAEEEQSNSPQERKKQITQTLKDYLTTSELARWWNKKKAVH